jgi:hypothetical protein
VIIQLVLPPVGTADDVSVKLPSGSRRSRCSGNCWYAVSPSIFAAISNPAMTYCGATGTLPEITKM